MKKLSASAGLHLPLLLLDWLLCSFFVYVDAFLTCLTRNKMLNISYMYVLNYQSLSSIHISFHINLRAQHSSTMASPPQSLHAVLIPIPSQSHIIPISSLSLLLARRGIIVTVVLPPLSAVRFQTIISMNPNLSIHISLLPPPSDPDLPIGSESLDSLPSLELRTRFLLACNSLLQPSRSILQTLNPKPSFVISSFHWSSDLASEFNIPRFNFGTVSCFTLFVTHQMQAHNLIGNDKPDSEPFLIPDLPHRIEFTNAQLPLMLRRSASNNGKNAHNQSVRSLDCSDGILMNTFEDLEFDYCKLYRGIKKNVFCIGPLSSIMGAKKNLNDDHACLKWLDSVKEPNSVVYVCFGSMARISSRQLMEIGLGLKKSNRRFIWVVKEEDFEVEIEELDFMEQGLVVRKWAPQVAILSHVAVGGFVSHCGWNSVLESVCAGVPMVTWPMFAEQFYNEKLVVDVLRVGVRVGVEVSVEGVNEDEDGASFVTKEEVERAVNELMDGCERRRRAEELGETARRAVEEGGSSELNMTLFIEHVKKKLSERLYLETCR